MNERDLLYLTHVASAIDAARSFTVDGREAFMAREKAKRMINR